MNLPRRTLGSMVVAIVAMVAAILGVLGTDAAHAKRCLPNGVCIDTTIANYGGFRCPDPWYFAGSDNPRRIYLSGAPRVRGVYVATKYNVRTHYSSNSRQISVDRDPISQACFFASRDSSYSVQACRYRLEWGRTYCGPWSDFKTEW